MAFLLARSLSSSARAPCPRLLRTPITRSLYATESISKPVSARAKKSSISPLQSASGKARKPAAPSSKSQALDAAASKAAAPTSPTRSSKTGSKARTAAARADLPTAKSPAKPPTPRTKAEAGEGRASLQTKGEDLSLLRKKLKWRSKQRGMKETILLLGTFAMEHVDTMTASQLTQFQQILEV